MTNVPAANMMGFSEIINNLYFGGRTPNPWDKFCYVNGLVCSTSYVGRMAGVSKANGGLGLI